jgi:hypothetical protein
MGCVMVDDIGMIVVQNIQSLPCLRMLFCVCKRFNQFCKHRFVLLNKEIEMKIRDEFACILKFENNWDSGVENTFVWQVLQVVLMRENVLHANRKVRLDVQSIYEAAKLTKLEFQQKIDSSNRRLQHLSAQLASSSKRYKGDDELAEQLLRDATQMADQFKADTAQLCYENAKAIKVMNAKLKALVKKSSKCLKKNLKEIEKVCEKCWKLANLLGNASWIPELKAIVNRINSMIADRLRIGARTRCKIEILNRDDVFEVVVNFVKDDQADP